MARKVIFKDDGINGLSNSPLGYKYVGYDGQVISEKNGATVSAIGGDNSIFSFTKSFLVSELATTTIGNPSTFLPITAEELGLNVNQAVNILAHNTIWVLDDDGVAVTATNIDIAVTNSNNVTMDPYNGSITTALVTTLIDSPDSFYRGTRGAVARNMYKNQGLYVGFVQSAGGPVIIGGGGAFAKITITLFYMKTTI
jgi:hypothetical protein